MCDCENDENLDVSIDLHNNDEISFLQLDSTPAEARIETEISEPNFDPRNGVTSNKIRQKQSRKRKSTKTMEDGRGTIPSPSMEQVPSQSRKVNQKSQRKLKKRIYKSKRTGTAPVIIHPIFKFIRVEENGKSDV